MPGEKQPVPQLLLSPSVQGPAGPGPASTSRTSNDASSRNRDAAKVPAYHHAADVRAYRRRASAGRVWAAWRSRRNNGY
jgi:hypothetical protein